VSRIPVIIVAIIVLVDAAAFAPSGPPKPLPLAFKLPQLAIPQRSAADVAAFLMSHPH
jgi:hypothetical protein